MTKEEMKEYQKRYYQEHKEALKARKKQWYQNNKDIRDKKHREYEETHKEQVSKKRREWAENNKDRIAERSKRYYQKNKEAITKRQKEYRSKYKTIRIPKKHGRIADIDLILEKMSQFKADIPILSDLANPEALLFNALYSIVDNATILATANNKEEE